MCDMYNIIILWEEDDVQQFYVINMYIHTRKHQTQIHIYIYIYYIYIYILYIYILYIYIYIDR